MEGYFSELISTIRSSGVEYCEKYADSIQITVEAIRDSNDETTRETRVELCKLVECIVLLAKSSGIDINTDELKSNLDAIREARDNENTLLSSYLEAMKEFLPE